MNIDKKKLSQIEESLFWAIIDAHKKDQISYIQMKKSASYILKHVDVIDSQKSLVRFLHNLSSHWKIFEPIFEKEQNNLKN